MTRVVYWNNIPAPYMVERFNAVARRGTVEFEAWFSARTHRDRSWNVDESDWQFRHRYLPAIAGGGEPTAFPAPLLYGPAPDLLVSLYADAGSLAGAELARRRGARTAFWVEVTFDSWVRRRKWKEAVKSRVLSRADGILTAGADGRAFARKYGAPDDRIHCVPHVIDFDHYAGGCRAADFDRDEFRLRLGVRGVTFIYVGRLWTGKGLTYLFDAFSDVQRTEPTEVSLLLVGDGRDEEFLRARARSGELRNVAFVGFQQDDALLRLYAAGDVFVFPTLGDPFGMVVLEAMACGLPVVATTSSGEIRDRVVDGVNGFLVPPGDSGPLAECMRLLARDPELRRRMGRASVERVADQSPDRWASAFESAVEKILGSRHRSQSGVDRNIKPRSLRRGLVS
jgi:glycosyltransferase involved in cell wall biosynthesis